MTRRAANLRRREQARAVRSSHRHRIAYWVCTTRTKKLGTIFYVRIGTYVPTYVQLVAKKKLGTISSLTTI